MVQHAHLTMFNIVTHFNHLVASQNCFFGVICGTNNFGCKIHCGYCSEANNKSIALDTHIHTHTHTIVDTDNQLQ